MTYTIVFRADASLKIGTGHMMRCLTLADALHAKGVECHFICRDHRGNLVALVRNKGYVAHVLPMHPTTSAQVVDDGALAHAHWLGATQKQDAEDCGRILAELQPHWLIVDHYGLDARWEATLKGHYGKLMVIDDLADRPHLCDLLLDQNLVANLHQRYDDLIPTRCARLLGPEYALLQHEYSVLRPGTPPRTGPLRRIFVYFGGADSSNLTGRVLSAFCAIEQSDIKLDVVINPASPHAHLIRHFAATHANIVLHEMLPSLAHLMVRADLAIGAGGASSWERCCLGLPSLVVTLAENQKPIASELDRQGIVRWLGHDNTVAEPTLISALENVLKDPAILEWSRRCMELVDGQGTEKVAGYVLLDTGTELTVRLARPDDEELLLSWANDPLVRQNAFSPDIINRDTHHVWFQERLRKTATCRIYVVQTEEGIPIGQVRFEQEDEQWGIDYALAPVARGRRLGKSLLQIALNVFRESQPEAQVLGRVKEGNWPSRLVFEELGFTEAGEAGSIVYHCIL